MNYIKIRDLTISNKGYYGIGASSTNFNEQFPQYLRITDINDDGKAPLTLPTCIDTNRYPEWRQYVLKENDIVFARTGNSTGRNYFCNKISKETVFAGFLIKFSINPKLIVPRYLGYYCQSQSYRNKIKSYFTGSTRANINAEQYSELLIPVAEKSRQQHIVNTISFLLLKSL